MTTYSENSITGQSKFNLDNTELFILAIFLKVVILGTRENRHYKNILDEFLSVQTELYQNYYLGSLTQQYKEIAYKYDNGPLTDKDLDIFKTELWDRIKASFKPFSSFEDYEEFEKRRAYFGIEIWGAIECVTLTDYDTYKGLVYKFKVERSQNFLKGFTETLSETLKFNNFDSIEKLKEYSDSIEEFSNTLSVEEDKQDTAIAIFKKYKSSLFKTVTDYFKFGIDTIDKLISGQVPKKSLIVIGGQAGHGKTVVGLNILYRNLFEYEDKKRKRELLESKRNKKRKDANGKEFIQPPIKEKEQQEDKGAVIFYSCEMSVREILERLCLIFMFNYMGCENLQRRWNEFEIKNGLELFENLIDKHKKFYLIDRFDKIEDIEASIKNIDRQMPIDMILIDYLQFIHSKDSKIELNETMRIKHTSSKLLSIKKRLRTNMVVLAQLNMKGKNYSVENMPDMNDIQYDSSIVQGADLVLNILTIDPIDKYGNRIISMPSAMHFHICKNRSGIRFKGCMEYFGATYGIR